MKKLIIIMITVLFVSVSTFGYSIMNNTLVYTGLYPQTITAAAFATSTAISTKGYERCHIIAPWKAAAASATAEVRLRFLSSATSDGTYVEVDSVTADATPLAYGILELEFIKDLGKPYIKVELYPTVENAISSVTVVFYGQDSRPF